MGFNSVYRSLSEIFPQIDARILKAVAIEHSKDADVAVEVVLTEVLPFFLQSSTVKSTQSQDQVSRSISTDKSTQSQDQDSRSFSTVRSTQSLDQDSKSISDGEAECEREDGQLRHRRARAVSRSSSGASSSSGTNSVAVEQDSDTGVANLLNGELANLNKASNASSDADSFNGCARTEELISFGKAPEKDVDAGVGDNSSPLSSALAHENYEYGDLFEMGANAQTKKLVPFGESVDYDNQAGPVKVPHFTPTDSMQEDAKASVNGRKDFDSPRAEDVNIVINGNSHQAEFSSSVIPLGVDNATTQLVGSNVQEQALTAQQCSPHVEFGSVTMKSKCDISNGSITSQSGNGEEDPILNTIVTRSGQVCSVDLLEEIIEDAKSNKKTLFTAMESVMNMMREVELQEKAAEQAREEASLGGLDILNKVQELKQMLAHAKEANDMHSGEVYGEKSILATEVRELQNRLLNLSEERDRSLAVLDEMREMLEARLVAAEEMRKAAEQEKLAKEESAKKALAEQEAIMEKVVQESKILQLEAEENAKLREFLMDRGRIVDSLQGEISVICQDVRLLKEKFDERVPLSKSISSSQTSCRLASSGSSVKSWAADIITEPREIPETSEKKSRTTSVNGESPHSKLRAEQKELLEEGWDIFDKDMDY